MICGAPLDIHQAARSKLCQSPSCIREHAAAAARRINQRHRRNRDQAVGSANATVRALMESGKLARRAQAHVAPVPSFNRQLRPPDPNRLDQYAAHLDDLLTQWVAEQERGQHNTIPITTSESGTRRADLYAQACATCRGNCCRDGNTHGHQTLDTIRRWFALNPDSDPDDCRQDYLSRLGGYSYDNSCVFHGAEGCFLPARMRSDTCNNRTCWEMRELQKQNCKQPVPVTIIIAAEADGVRRINVIDSQSGERLEPEIETGAGH